MLKVYLYDAISRVRITSHDFLAASSVHIGRLLPNDIAHIVKADSFTKSDNLRVNGDHFISAIIGSPCELVTNIDTQPTAVFQHAETLHPNEVQIVDVFLIGIIKAYLVAIAIIFQLPVWR